LRVRLCGVSSHVKVLSGTQVEDVNETKFEGVSETKIERCLGGMVCGSANLWRNVLF